MDKVVLLPLFSFMGKITPPATQPVSQEASNYDEVFMQHSLLFDDSLKVLLILDLLLVGEICFLDQSSDDSNPSFHC